MTETRRIKLHLGKCIEDLDKLHTTPEIKSKKAKLLCKTAQKLFETAEQSREKGDEEYAYVCYMKYIRIVAYLNKDQEYQREKKYYNDMLGVKNPTKAISMAETLKSSLIDRYATEQKNKRLNEIKESELFKQQIEENRKKARESAPETPDISLPEPEEVTITSQHLYSLLKNSNFRIMILDARTMLDFMESHIEHLNCINVPEDAITPGKTANALEQSLSPSSKLVWAERALMDLIVMVDWDSKAVIPGKHLYLLKTILLKWDIKVQYSRSPVALRGGYEDWLLLYPHHTTNAHVKRMNKHNTEHMLSEIDYPIWSELSPPVTKPEPAGLGGPVIDRSSKVAAMQVYEERARNMQMILQKQEKIADTSLNLELQRIEAEQDWKKVSIEKENEGRDELRAQYQLREQEILSQLLLLENKQFDMEQENLSLREQLEEYQRREKEERTKLPENATKQEIAHSEEGKQRVQNASREVEAAQARIRATEEQKADLHRRREALEIERRRRLQEAREKKKPALDKEEEGDTFMTSASSMHRSQSSPDVTKQLSSSEEESTTPVFDRSTKPIVKNIQIHHRTRDLQPVWGDVGRGLTGLKNLGNTCYMNSIIQCLNNTTILVTYFSSGQYLEHVNRGNNTRGAIAEELATVVRALWSGQYRFIAPEDFRREVGKHQRAFRGAEQQDSHEFLTILMDWLHDDLQFPIQPPHKESLAPPERAWLEYTQARESLVLRLFYGQMVSSVICTVCGEQSRTYESFSNLSLELPANANRCTLTDCLKLYLNGETIPGWNCPSCKEKRVAIKKLDISRLPPILVIHFKRFYVDPKEYMCNVYRKKQTYIEFPLEELDMSEFTAAHTDTLYNLYAVSNHYGSMEGGHYTAYCKSSMYGKWHKYDDHVVSEISSNEVKSSAAYILFYTTCHQWRPT